jgi:hypothetical protein
VNITEYVAVIIGRPSCQAWTAPADQKEKIIRDAVDSAMGQILGEGRQFPFAVGVKEMATEVGEPLYTVEGNWADCGEVLSVRYGTDKKLLNLVDADQLEAYESTLGDDDDSTTAATTTDVTAWCVIGTEGEFPVVRIIGAPDIVTTLYFRYRRTNMPVEEFPRNWRHVLTAGVEAELFGAVGSIYQKSALGLTVQGRVNYDARFRERLSLMVDAYQRGKADESPSSMDSKWREANRRHNAKPGYH